MVQDAGPGRESQLAEGCSCLGRRRTGGGCVWVDWVHNYLERWLGPRWSWLKVALQCSVSGWTAEGAGRGRFAKPALAYGGEARRGAIFDGKRLRSRQRYPVLYFFDGYLPPKIATTTSRAIHVCSESARERDRELRAGRTKDRWVTYSLRGTTGHLYIHICICICIYFKKPYAADPRGLPSSVLVDNNDILNRGNLRDR